MATAFGAWFLGLLVATIVATYLLHIAPRTRRQWMYMTIAVAFLAWLLLPLMHPVRSF